VQERETWREEGDAVWGPGVGEGERDSCTGSGSIQGGPWAGSLAGPNRSPAVFSSFFFF
jgi:hypothetical protein